MKPNTRSHYQDTIFFFNFLFEQNMLLLYEIYEQAKKT
jgi:hypothetical protein